MPWPRLVVEAEARPALELLIGLSAATSAAEAHEESWATPTDRWSRELRSAVAAAGADSGEAWLHLLGLALELPTVSATSFVGDLERVDALELRRHLVGVYVPAWVTLVGADTLARAASGDDQAIAELLEHPRYYAGRAGESLTTLLSVPPAETKRRLLAALRLFAGEVFAPREHEIMAPLLAEAETTRGQAEALAPRDLIAAVTRGYLYDPEPELGRVVLVPHAGARPLLLLCQHRDARVICYPLTPEQLDPEASLAERAVALGRAIGDGRRVQILRRLAIGDATLDELAEATGLARSTTHHHLTQLRAAGLAALRGNARGYWYALRPEGLAEARRALEELALAPSATGEATARPSRRRGSAGRPRRAPTKNRPTPN
jgi:DNA-binding transcriptional ArsR family regulator